MPVVVSLKVYLVLGILTVVNTIWILTTRIELIWNQLIPFGFITSILAASIIIFLRIQKKSSLPSWILISYSTLQGLLFLNIAWINLRIFNHVSMTTGFPYQDELLRSWDNYIGLDWLAYFKFIHDRPFLIDLLDMSYTSLTPLSVFALLFLIITKQFDRSRFFLETFFFTSVAAIIIGLFFPAEAAVAVIIQDLTSYSNFTKEPGVYHIYHMEVLRAEEGPIILNLSSLPGLVTFPSLHTAAGIILIFTFWGLKGFTFVFSYSVLMIAATPVFGGHYIVDLLAGTFLAIVVMWIVWMHQKTSA